MLSNYKTRKDKTNSSHARSDAAGSDLPIMLIIALSIQLHLYCYENIINLWLNLGILVHLTSKITVHQIPISMLIIDDFNPFSIKRSREIFLKMCSVLSNNSSNIKVFHGWFSKNSVPFSGKGRFSPKHPLNTPWYCCPIDNHSVQLYEICMHEFEK